MAQEKTYASVSWCAQDIMHLYNVTREQAEEFLHRYDDTLEESMLTAGEQTIRHLAETFEQWELREDDQEAEEEN